MGLPFASISNFTDHIAGTAIEDMQFSAVVDGLAVNLTGCEVAAYFYIPGRKFYAITTTNGGIRIDNHYQGLFTILSQTINFYTGLYSYDIIISGPKFSLTLQSGTWNILPAGGGTITKASIESVLTGPISSHSHNYESDGAVTAHESKFNHGQISTAYGHSQALHAPMDAQKNSDITKGEIEAKLTGPIISHSHASSITKEAVESVLTGVISTHSHAGGSGDGFIINVQALTSTPADGATVYFGMLPKAPTTTANISKIHVRKACTLKVANIYVYSGTAGSNESWSLYVRKNNTTDTLIKTIGISANERVFENIDLNISLLAGDYVEIKGVQPTWATNPATTIYGGYLYFE